MLEKKFDSLVEIMHVAFPYLSTAEHEDMLIHAFINQQALFNEPWGLLEGTVTELMADGGKTIHQQIKDKVLARELSRKASKIRMKESSKELWSLMADTWRENK